MKCPKCQAENSDSAKFCIDCGQSFQADQTCPYCKHANKATARFCQECGLSLVAAPNHSAVTEAKPLSSSAAPAATSFANFAKAIHASEELRFRPDPALGRLVVGERMPAHFPDEKNDALEHLDFAIKEFREMKMQPSLERALRRKEILKA